MRRDVVVMVPGILGSTLAHRGKLVWAPSAGAAMRAIRTFGRSLGALRLPEGIGDQEPDDGVEAVDVMPDLHVLPGIWTANIGYSGLLRELERRCNLTRPRSHVPNLIPFAYDWRLSNRVNGIRLGKRVSPALERWRALGGEFADARLVFVCHSMGGLVARWFVEMEGGAEVTRKIVTIGTPHRGALKALDQLVNGVRKGIGPLSLDLTELALSMPSMYELLPQYACLEAAGGPLRRIGETSVPGLATTMMDDAARFHRDLDGAAAAHGAYDLHPIVGTRQRTPTTARITGRSLHPLYRIGGGDERGDATVPRLSATPERLPPDSPSVRWVADQHGALQHNSAVFDELERVLIAPSVIHRASADLELEAQVAELVLAGEEIEVHASVDGGERIALQADVADETGRPVTEIRLYEGQDGHRGVIEPLPPGAYQVIVRALDEAAPVSPVTCATLVWEQ
ncbi:MAG: lipase/acyltransferase domain-containing protein [Egibacteraceae bacterium]